VPASFTRVEWSLVELSVTLDGLRGFLEERKRSRTMRNRCQSAGANRMKMCDLNRQRALNDKYAC
jgi:hypothetical protein